MKKKSRCRVASAILGTTVLSVNDLPNNDLAISDIPWDFADKPSGKAVKSPHGVGVCNVVTILPSLSLMLPASASSGIFTVADIQFSVLYSSGDIIYSGAKSFETA